MAGVKFNQVCSRENRKVNATQILCDLYIDIVPTVLLNNIVHCVHCWNLMTLRRKFSNKWFSVPNGTRQSDYFSTTTLFIVHLAGMLLHRWHLHIDDKKRFRKVESRVTKVGRDGETRREKKIEFRNESTITTCRSWVRLLPSHELFWKEREARAKTRVTPVIILCMLRSTRVQYGKSDL